MSDLETQIMAELGTVMEPELHRDLVTLKMIRDLKVEGSTASFTIMLTTPACPLKSQIEQSARDAVLRVPEIEEVHIKLDSDVSTDGRARGRMNLDIKNLIAVSSGKGGVGKSTIAVNLAIALQQSGAKVGLMDADILGPNLPMMLGIDSMPAATEEKLTPAEAFGLKVMSMGFLVNPDQPMIWRGPMVHSAIRQFFTDVNWGSLDYMVIDLPPGPIIVTQPQDVAVSDALRGLMMFGKVDVPIIGVVENMSGEFFGEGGGRRLAEKQQVPFLGSIPLDPNVRVGGDVGKPVVVDYPDSPAALAFAQFAQEVAARISILNFNQYDNIIPITTIG
jgi:ATP-binding protein involved in chromosome partitioning